MDSEMPVNTAVFTLENIVSKKSFISTVIHDNDGDWQFLCGEEMSITETKIISIGQIIEIDPSIRELLGMSIGSKAVRTTISAPWTIIENEH